MGAFYWNQQTQEKLITGNIPIQLYNKCQRIDYYYYYYYFRQDEMLRGEKVDLTLMMVQLGQIKPIGPHFN